MARRISEETRQKMSDAKKGKTSNRRKYTYVIDGKEYANPEEGGLSRDIFKGILKKGLTEYEGHKVARIPYIRESK